MSVVAIGGLLGCGATVRAELTLSFELLPGSSPGSGTEMTFEVFVHSTEDFDVRLVAADLPCQIVTPMGTMAAVTPNPIGAFNQSNAASGSIPWLFAMQGFCAGGDNDGAPCSSQAACTNGGFCDCSTTNRCGGLRPIAQAACRASGAPGAGEPAYLLPGNQKRYLYTIKYALSDCAAGDYVFDFEAYSMPAQQTDLTRIVGDDGAVRNFTPVLPTISAIQPLYSDIDVPYGVVSLNDLLCVLFGYNTFKDCPNGDIAPCGGDGIIELADVSAALAAYGGQYACPHPCEP